MKEPETKLEALLEAVTIESNLLYNSNWRAIVDIFDDVVETNPETGDYPKSVRTTCGIYGLKYLPKSDMKRNPRFPYVFINDMLPMRICVSGAKHLRMLADEIPEIAWILRNSNYNPGLFHWCAVHPGLKIPFSVNFVEYCDKIKKKADKKGIETETNTFKPLVNFVTSKTNLNKIFGGRKAWITKKSAYSQTILKQRAACANEYKDGE